MPRYPSWGSQTSGGRAQKWVWGCLGVFGGLWHLLRHGSCLSRQDGWASGAPSERMKTPRLCVNGHIPINLPGGSFTPEPVCVREGIGAVESTVLPPQGLFLFPHVAQNPSSCKAELGLSWSSSVGACPSHLGCPCTGQRFHCTPKGNPNGL